jgi:hypothetical protein
MAPWPDQVCPHPNRGRHVRDLLAEMLPDDDRVRPEFKAVLGQAPGGAITCPYCQGAIEYEADGQTLMISDKAPLRYSRTTMEIRAMDYGSQKNPPEPSLTPQQWIAEEKLMPGALRGYQVRGGLSAMRLTDGEVEFLAAWAREEWEPRCYQRPAHQLQLANRVAGALLISFIKAWTNAEGKKDRDILDAAQNPAPTWPWSTQEEFQARLEEARRGACREAPVS